MSTTLGQVRMDLPLLHGPLPGPHARAAIARDAKVVSPSYTRCYPLVARKGEGAMVEDVDGNRFLDFSAGIAVVAVDIGHPPAWSRPSNGRPPASSTCPAPTSITKS